MEVAEYLGHVAADGTAALAAGRQGLGDPVPSCPAWTVTDLLGHLGRVHRWVEEMVRTRAAERAAFPPPPSPEELPGWYDEGLARLLVTLDHVDPDELVWNWMASAPAPARFWPRRMAHETAVHRWDAENSFAGARPIDGALALDGVEEYLDIVSFVLEKASPDPEFSGTLGLEATDAGFARTVTMRPRGLGRCDGVDHADAVVRASASDLLLWMCGRNPLGDGTVELEGDASVAQRWRAIHFD